MREKDDKLSLTLITALLVLLIGGLAVGSLWALRKVHGQMAHSSAARSVLDQGRTIVTRLANQSIVKSAARDDHDWGPFAREVQSIHALENGLQYVSIVKDGVTVWQQQMSSLDGSFVEPPPMPDEVMPRDVAVRPSVLSVGGENLPVVVFLVRFPGEDGKERMVEVALKKDTVGRFEADTVEALASMFRLTVLAVLVSFGVCVVLVVWMMHREQRRERMRREEEHLAFAGMLANGIVHDFRNPMSSLRLDAQMLNKEVEKGVACRAERLQELSGRIRDTTDRLDKVFQEFLYMSRPPTETLEHIDLVSCVRESVAMIQSRIEQAGVKIEVVAVGGVAIKVAAFSSSVRRALLNVVTNAEHFSKAGDVITIRVSRSGAEGWVEVMDQGPGVPADLQKRIFDMFVTTRPSGTGIGLFLAKAAVERCGGSIRVHNRNEGGACFTISLPLAGKEEEGSKP